MGRYVHITSLLFFIYFLHSVSSQLPSTQTTTMNSLYGLLQNSTGPSFQWNRTRNPDPCSWNGVSCSPDNSSVTQLSLSRLFISTSDFLPLVCAINSLQSLDLSNNHLSSIPDQFISECGQISGLKRLNFSCNKLSGSLPTFLNFSHLESLDLSHNLMTGNIGLQLDGLLALRSLNLSYNQFTGSIPTNFGQAMAPLEELQLSKNHFHGNIPESIANYSNLTLIDLNVNLLSGSIPVQFRQLSSLQILVLSSNNLTGEVPGFLSSIQSLSRFAANQNNFTGTVPFGITMYLKNLDLSYNKISGTIPSNLLSPPNLQSLDLSYNVLVGTIPENMSSNLYRLRLSGNKLNGPIPSSPFVNLRRLMYLELESNELTGNIPSELGLCETLALLNLANNNLSGVLPLELGNLTNLQELLLQHNHLIGEIPIQITRLNRLQRVNISWNSINGSIPSSISSLRNLAQLDLQANNLTGTIPNSIGRLNYLLELQLGRNQLGGVIPVMPISLQIALNLSHNLFHGSIPFTLSILSGLEVLDLSNNRFSGEIPYFLTQMVGLTQLVLSDNQLSGIIPNFRQFVTIYTRGNPGLINSSSSSNPTPLSPKQKKSIHVAILVGVASAGVAVGIVAIIASIISRRIHRIKEEQLQPEQDISSPPHIIQGHVLTANSFHRSNMDFATAMREVTNPSKIVLKTRFSTYYKAAMPSGMNYFVKKINCSDKIYQLGSHEKFGEELEILGKLSNSNVMTPLAYVLTIDSAYIFYEFAQKGTLYDVLHGSLGHTLDWASRYSIAIGVAQGLAFLHGCATGSILLLDLSSRSIMLKSLKEPQVGDIELYKVIDPSKSTGSLSTVAGSVGYIPPEYAYTMRITMAGNVYSFGVILLELVTGRAAVSQGTELTKWVLSRSAQPQDKLDQILDFSVSRTSVAVRTQMLAVLKVALACVSISPEARPKMKSIIRMLLNAR